MEKKFKEVRRGEYIYDGGWLKVKKKIKKVDGTITLECMHEELNLPITLTNCNPEGTIEVKS